MGALSKARVCASTIGKPGPLGLRRRTSLAATASSPQRPCVAARARSSIHPCSRAGHGQRAGRRIPGQEQYVHNWTQRRQQRRPYSPWPSSSGCLSPSMASRRNSFSSSRNRTPWCPSVGECPLRAPGLRPLSQAFTPGRPRGRSPGKSTGSHRERDRRVPVGPRVRRVRARPTTWIYLRLRTGRPPPADEPSSRQTV
jgi:hypothetical protein